MGQKPFVVRENTHAFCFLFIEKSIGNARHFLTSVA